MPAIFGYPGKAIDRSVETVVIASKFAMQATTWLANIHRVGILPFAERQFPKLYDELDGGDKRIMRAFVDPESISNTCSLLGGERAWGKDSEYRAFTSLVALAMDAFGSEASFDNSFVERSPGADQGPERWFFINGIVTSRELARRNVKKLDEMFDRRFTLIHNPTQGLTDDLMESSLQKFTNINTEPVARAYLEISEALLDDSVKLVSVIAHSQGTIIMGDVLDLIYVSIDPKYFDRTNMDDEDIETFMRRAAGRVKAAELRAMKARLSDGGSGLLKKLELYMFANAASRMCYIDEDGSFPHIESYANEHDLVARLGCLARDEFHREDLIRIDGSLFTCDRYGHLLNAHYLPDFIQGRYRLRAAKDKLDNTPSVGTSLHDPVTANPCGRHPKQKAGPPDSRLRAHYDAVQRALLPAAQINSAKASKNAPQPRPRAGRYRAC